MCVWGVDVHAACECGCVRACHVELRCVRTHHEGALVLDAVEILTRVGFGEALGNSRGQRTREWHTLTRHEEGIIIVGQVSGVEPCEAMGSKGWGSRRRARSPGPPLHLAKL